MSIKTESEAARLGVDMGHLSVGADRPAHDRVVVVGIRRRILREPVLARGLHAAFFVGGAALEDCGLAVPLPRQAEAYERSRALLADQRRGGPARAAVGRDLDLADATG